MFYYFKKYIYLNSLHSVLMIMQLLTGFLALTIGLGLLEGTNHYTTQVKQVASADVVRLHITDTGDTISSEKLQRFYEQIRANAAVDKIGTFLQSDIETNELGRIRFIFIDQNYLDWKDNKLLKNINFDEQAIPIPVYVGQSFNLPVGTIIHADIPDDRQLTTVEKQFVVAGKLERGSLFWKGGTTSLDGAITGTDSIMIAPMQEEQQFGQQLLTRINENMFIKLHAAEDLDSFKFDADDLMKQYGFTGTLSTISEQLEAIKKQNKTIILFSLIFASLLLLLSIFGVIGVTLISMVRRKREFGIRYALGSTPGGLAVMICNEIFVHFAVAFVLGLLGTLLLKSLINFQVTLLINGTTIMYSFILVLILSLTASLLPLMKFVRQEPIQYMRGD